MGLFSRLRTSEYARHSAILMTGTVISMLLQTVSFVWLGNYYNDTAMGLYQYLNTAYSILLIAATGRYEPVSYTHLTDGKYTLTVTGTTQIEVSFKVNPDAPDTGDYTPILAAALLAMLAAAGAAVYTIRRRRA